MKKAIKILLAIIAVIALICGMGVYRYTSNVPKLSLHNVVYDLLGSSTYSASDMVDVKCRGGYKLMMYIMDTNISTAKLSDDKSSIYTGDTSGYIHVSIVGVGDHSEGGKSVEAYLFISLNAEEQSELIENSTESFRAMDKYIREEFFTEENNTPYARQQFISCYNTDDAYGLHKDMTEELFAQYVEKFQSSELVGVIAGYYYNQLYEPSYYATRYYALYKTSSGESLYFNVGGNLEPAEDGMRCTDIHIIEEAPDSGGSHVYDVLLNIINNASSSELDITKPYTQVKIGNDFTLIVDDETYESYEARGKADYVFNEHNVDYNFILPLP